MEQSWSNEARLDFSKINVSNHDMKKKTRHSEKKNITNASIDI